MILARKKRHRRSTPLGASPEGQARRRHASPVPNLDDFGGPFDGHLAKTMRPPTCALRRLPSVEALLRASEAHKPNIARAEFPQQVGPQRQIYTSIHEQRNLNISKCGITTEGRMQHRGIENNDSKQDRATSKTTEGKHPPVPRVNGRTPSVIETSKPYR